MAYRKSTARLEFEAWKTRTLRVVAKAEKNYAVKADLSDYTLCAALLLTHAHFENYVKDICAFFVQNVNSKGLRADSLPGRLRECALLATFPHVDFKHFYTFKLVCIWGFAAYGCKAPDTHKILRAAKR